jgi:MFS family permease
MQSSFPPKENSNTALATIAVVVWMWFAYLLNYCDRQAIFAMFPVLKTDLQMTDLQLGLTGTVFLWVYGLGCPIAGILADRFPKGNMVVVSLVLWSLVTILTGLSTSATMLLGLRAAMGISEALFMPAAIALTSESTPQHWRSKAVASLTTAQIVGIVAGASFGGSMAQSGHWRQAFFLLGSIGLLFALPYAWFFLIHLPHQEKIRSYSHPTNGNAPPYEPSVTNQSWSQRIQALFRTPTFCLLCLIFPLFVFGLWMIYSWLASYIQEKFGLTMAQAGWTSTAYLQSATLVGLFVGGFVADYWRSKFQSGRFAALLVSLIGCAPILVAIGQVDQLEHLKILLVAFGFLSGWMMGNIFPAAFEVIAKESRASAVGILNLFGAILSGFAPLLVGAWKESLGLPHMLGIAAIAYSAAATLLLLTIFVYFPSDLLRRDLESSILEEHELPNSNR